jgi:hypothetical protein
MHIYTVRGENCTEFLFDYGWRRPHQTLISNLFQSHSHYLALESPRKVNCMLEIQDSTFLCGYLYFIHHFSLRGHGVRKVQLQSLVFYPLLSNPSFQSHWERILMLHDKRSDRFDSLYMWATCSLLHFVKETVPFFILLLCTRFRNSVYLEHFQCFFPNLFFPIWSTTKFPNSVPENA